MLGRSPCCSLVLSNSLCSEAWWSHKHLSIAHTASETLIQPFSQVQMCLKPVHMQLHIQRQAYTELLCLADDEPKCTHHQVLIHAIWVHQARAGQSALHSSLPADTWSSFLPMYIVKAWYRCRQKAR